jgi:glycosyltransferase involved in cell wall biosynthesis
VHRDAPVRVAFVVPRYGADIRGGAETGARMLAEHLARERDIEVEVLTTCARDAITWEDDLPEGGVRVHRVRSEAGRDPSFHPLWARLREDPEHASREDMERWVDLQGPRTPALLDAVAATDADVVAFYPYLYYPTVRGLPLVAERAVLHPAAHEEPALYLPIFDQLFARCRGFAYHSRSERALVQARFKVASAPQVLLGLGVEEPPSSDADPAVRETLGLEDVPYVVCVGRVDDQKGTGMLARAFRSYKERHPGSLRLVLVGQVVDEPAPSPDVTVTGMVDDATKWALVRGATVLAAPSPYESFSLTVLEAFTAGVPVLVNAACGPTREHCAHSGAGLWFADFAEFEGGLELLTTDAHLRAVMGAKARAYAANFAWPVIVERYCAFLAHARGGSGSGVARPEAVAPAQGNGVP